MVRKHLEREKNNGVGSMTFGWKFDAGGTAFGFDRSGCPISGHLFALCDVANLTDGAQRV
jgi:hypothetical protein